MATFSRNPGLSESQEDYLEAILQIERARMPAHGREIARRMAVTGASVTGALRLLARKHLVSYTPYEPVRLTAIGRAVARRVSTRHEALRDFFLRVLRATPAEAEEFACRIEHVLPPRLLKRLAGLALPPGARGAGSGLKKGRS
jgi:DtxR family Mn-dependent transcriptional regulator